MAILEYVWLDGYSVQNLRSKVRIVKGKIDNIDQCPEWGFDGSSTEQAEGGDSDLFSSLFVFTITALQDQSRQDMTGILYFAKS